MWLEHAGNANYFFERQEMKRSNQPQVWLDGKFGEAVNLWHCDLKLYYEVNRSTTEYGQFREGTNIFFDYRYCKKSVVEGQVKYFYEAY